MQECDSWAIFLIYFNISAIINNSNFEKKCQLVHLKTLTFQMIHYTLKLYFNLHNWLISLNVSSVNCKEDSSSH